MRSMAVLLPGMSLFFVVFANDPGKALVRKMSGSSEG